MFQTLLVTGGYNEKIFDDYIPTTELLVYGSHAWVSSGNLPARLESPRAATVDNRVLVSGMTRIVI